MYKFEFGQLEKRTAYIFEVKSNGAFAGITPPHSANWRSLKGSAEAVMLRMDEEGGSDYFPGQLMKQSVSFSFFRDKDNPSVLEDLLQGEDNDWRCVILSGDEAVWYRASGGEAYPMPTNSGTGDVLFYGYLTNETYSEAYLPNANVNITFHDRLGELKDVVFDHDSQYISVTDLLATVLQGLPLNKYLNIEFPYSYDGSDISPQNMVLDVAKFIGKKRQDVLKTFLKDFGLNLYINYTYTSESGDSFRISEMIQRCGIITIRHLGLFQETEHEFYSYELESGVYDYKAMVTRYSVPKFIPQDYLTLNRSPKVEFIRKAKWVDATAKFELRDNVIYPYPLTVDNLERVDKDRNYSSFLAKDYNYYTKDWATSPLIFSWLRGTWTNVATAVGAVGNSQKLGVKLVDTFTTTIKPFIMSKPSLMIRGDENFGLTIEAFTIKQMDVRYCLFAYSPKSDDIRVWHKPSEVAAWFAYTPGDSITPINLLNNITPNEYFSVTNSYNIPQPGAYSLGESYYISMYITYDDWHIGQFGCWITDAKLSIQTRKALPPSLTLRTNISDTRRSPIDEEFSFINLPKIGNDQSLFYNGIYIKNPTTEAIIAPETLTYNGNDATILVHQSELIGGQMTETRWAFKSKILEPATEAVELITAQWGGYVCEQDSSENNGYQRAVTYTVIKRTGGEVASDNDYSILDAIPDTSFGAISSAAFAALSSVDYDARVTAFRAYVSDTESLSDVGAYETNQARSLNETACPIPVEIRISLIFEMTPGGSLHSISGNCVMERTLPLTDVTETIDSETSDLKASFTASSSEQVDVDFSDVIYYIDSVAQTTYSRWRLATPEAEWFFSNRVLRITKNTFIQVQISNEPFL